MQSNELNINININMEGGKEGTKEIGNDIKSMCNKNRKSGRQFDTFAKKNRLLNWD